MIYTYNTPPNIFEMKILLLLSHITFFRPPPHTFLNLHSWVCFFALGSTSQLERASSQVPNCHVRWCQSAGEPSRKGHPWTVIKSKGLFSTPEPPLSFPCNLCSVRHIWLLAPWYFLLLWFLKPNIPDSSPVPPRLYSQSSCSLKAQTVKLSSCLTPLSLSLSPPPFLSLWTAPRARLPGWTWPTSSSHTFPVAWRTCSPSMPQPLRPNILNQFYLLLLPVPAPPPAPIFHFCSGQHLHWTKIMSTYHVQAMRIQ